MSWHVCACLPLVTRAGTEMMKSSTRGEHVYVCVDAEIEEAPSLDKLFTGLQISVLPAPVNFVTTSGIGPSTSKIKIKK